MVNFVLFLSVCSMMSVGICTGEAVSPVTIEDLRMLLESSQDTTTSDIHDMFQNLQDFISAKVEERLINMEEMLQSVVHRQLTMQHCNHKLCQPHGTCYVPKGTEGFSCECEEYWHGPYCNESNPCHLSLYNAKFEGTNPEWEEPLCDEEGFYQGMQYEGQMSICVTAQGEPLRYSVPRLEIGDDMPCDCARDEFDSVDNKMVIWAWQYEEFNCTEQGGYY